MAREELGAQADAEEWLLLLERDLQPFDLAADEVLFVVGAHRSAEDHRAGVVFERVGKRIAETRPPDVE
jgi:hypothetical protein